MDVVGGLEAATSSEPAFTEAFRGAVLHHFRGDPEVVQSFQNSVTRVIAGDGGGLPDVEGMDYAASQEARQRNAAQSLEAAKAGVSAADPEQLEAMVDLAASRIFGSGYSEDRIFLQTGRERENSLPILQDFATNRVRRPDGPGDKLTEKIFKAVAARDPKEVMKNCEKIQNLSSSRPSEQKVPRAQRSAQRELMYFLERMSQVTDHLPDEEESKGSDSSSDEEPLRDAMEPDPRPNVTKKRITVAVMRKLLHRAREEGVLSLRRLGSDGELEGLFRDATLDAIEEAIGVEGAERTGTYLQLIDSISTPGPMVRRAIDQALVTRGGPEAVARADGMTDLDRMVDGEQETELQQAFQAAARRDPRTTLLETAELMEASASQSRPGTLSWPVGIREEGSTTSVDSGVTDIPTRIPTPVPTPTYDPDHPEADSGPWDSVPGKNDPLPDKPEEGAAAGSKDPPGTGDQKMGPRSCREPSPTYSGRRAAPRRLSGQLSAPERQVGSAS